MDLSTSEVALPQIRRHRFASNSEEPAEPRPEDLAHSPFLFLLLFLDCAISIVAELTGFCLHHLLLPQPFSTPFPLLSATKALLQLHPFLPPKPSLKMAAFPIASGSSPPIGRAHV